MRRLPTWWRRTAALALAVAMLAGAEFACRRSGYGGAPPLVRSIGVWKGRTYAETDSGAGASFFLANRAGRGANRPTSFFEPKATNSLRVVLAGESAMLGFPYPPQLTAEAFLRLMLQERLPGRDVELINVAATAVASFPAKELALQMLAHDPDALVVYAGNNEYYGAYGVASRHFMGTRPGMLAWARRVQRLALAQFLAAHLPMRSPGAVFSSMEAMIGETRVPANSPLRARAAGNLSHHVGGLIRAYRARGIPVIVCTAPVNERDLAPFGEDDAARAMHRRGQDLLAGGLQAEAARAFAEAVEQDPMPWRATESMNRALRETAKGEGAVVCDLEALFRAESPGGSAGWELMIDHVHPNLRGQHLVARSLADALLGLFDPRGEPRPAWAPWQDEAQRLGVNRYEACGVALGMISLFRSGFMQSSNPRALDLFQAEARALLDEMPPVVAGPFQEQVGRLTSEAKRPSVSGIAGRLCMDIGRLAEAADLFAMAQRYHLPFAPSRREYARLELECRRRLAGEWTEADRVRLRDEIERGRFLLERGADPTGLTDACLGQFHAWLGETNEAAACYARAAAKRSSGAPR